MNQQSIFFLQALWDGGVNKPQVLNLAKKAMEQQCARDLAGLRDSNTLWISDEARDLRRQMEKIIHAIQQITVPSQLISMLNRYEKVLGELRALQIKTMQSLTGEAGPVIEKLHVIVPPLFTMAGKRLENQMGYQLYRIMVFGSMDEIKAIKMKSVRTVYHWIEFYKNTLQPRLLSINERLDGRWAYERRRVMVLRHLIVEQYIAVPPREEELSVIPGRACIGTGQGGDMRIFGRGRLTNLRPEELTDRWEYLSKNHISLQSLCQIEELQTRYPEEILEACFNGKPYLIDAPEFFQVYNQYLIGQTLYYRTKRGNCMYCGGMISHGQCEQCGEPE